MLLLGDLEIPTFGLKGLNGSDAWVYAVIGVIEGKPKRQFVAPDARTLTLAIGIHAQFGSPQRFIDRAKAMADDREVFVLQVAGTGLVLGDYVIEKCDWSPRACFPDGTLLSASVTLSLADPGLERALEPKPRPIGVVDEAEDIVTTPKAEDTSVPFANVTPAEIARL